MNYKYLKKYLYFLVVLWICIGARVMEAQSMEIHKPLVLAFKAKKNTLKAGEKIDFLTCYTLPKGRNIAAEKWSYKALLTKQERVIYEKPELIFESGLYEVNIQIKDSEGMWSEPASTYIHISDQSVQSELLYRLEKNMIGSKVNQFGSENYRAYKKIQASQCEEEKGKLLISNSPEKVKEKGILYEGTSSGKGRLMIHHLHDMDGDKDYRLVLLVTNLSDQSQRVHLNHYAVKGPCKDVLYVGEQLLLEYWGKTKREVIYDLPPHQTGIIYKQLQPWVKGDALSSYMDFYTQDKVKWQVLCVENGDNLASYQHYCEKDRHIRGTFETIKQIYSFDLNKEAVYFPIGEKTEFLLGVDEVLNKETCNKGNFGMEYEFHLKANEDTIMVLNPRGDVFRGAILWNDTPCAVPNRGCLRGEWEASLLGEIKAGEQAVIKYMLPNGSSAPVLFVSIPKKNLEKMSNLKEICK